MPVEKPQEEPSREPAIMKLIYSKLNDILGAGSQLFCMQFPAQPLNPRLYSYDTSDRNSVLTRPYTVAEQEFRLSDQLFDASPITAGPNGERLSVVYDTLINNLVPKIDYLVPFLRDRAGLGRFLLESSGETDERGRPISRIELCKQLYNDYLEAKNCWEEEKNTRFEKLRQLKDGLDEYARWLSSFGTVREEELNNRYNDVVVRGHLHEVLTILGYLNASSVSEQLELCKQRLRNSSRLSLDESMTVYPVQFQPNSWFKALAPNLKPEDLTMGAESIRGQFVAKQRELARARAELQQMDMIAPSADAMNELKTAIEDATKTINKAEGELIQKYGEGVVSLAKMYYGVMKNDDGSVGDVNRAKAKQLGATDEHIQYLDEAVKGIAATYASQQSLTKSVADLASLKAQQAQIKSDDWKFNRANLERRVSELQGEVDYYSDLLMGVVQEKAKTTRIELTREASGGGKLVYQIGLGRGITGGSFKLKVGGQDSGVITVEMKPQDTPPTTTPTIDDDKLMEHIASALNGAGKPAVTVEKVAGSPGYFRVTFTTDKDLVVVADETGLEPHVELKQVALLPTPRTEEEAEISGMFQDVVLSISSSQQDDQLDKAANSSSSRWNVSAWLASAGGQTSQSSASTRSRHSFFNENIEIGFRVAKVSFDRGGWFNPHIFKMSGAFSRLADLHVAPGLKKEDVLASADSQASDQDSSHGNGTSYMLPAFPVAMVIAKDITIKVKRSSESSWGEKEVLESASATSGGFLCFSVSSGSASSSSHEATFHGAHGEDYYIRIPGPQVLGYFLQFVPQDTAEPYKPLTSASGENPVLEALELFNTANGKLLPAPVK